MLWVLMAPAMALGLDIQADVDRTKITVNESVELTVTLSGGEGIVDTSPIKDFRVMSQGTSTRIQILNNHVSKKLTYNFRLVPARIGQLTIPALPVSSGGLIVDKTRPMTVQVTKTAGAAGAGNRDVFVTAEISNPAPYEGQQVTYIFRLFYAVSISNARLEKPAFSGFNAKEVEPARSFSTRISGREYNVTEVNFVLIPIRSGELTIEPSVLACDVIRRTSGRNSIFNDPFFGGGQLEPGSFSAEPLTVTVKPLPHNDTGIPFSGLVGKFSMQAELENPEIAVGDSTTLALTIEGTGNIIDAGEPQIVVSDAFKVYSDSPEEQITFSSTGYSGKKIFRKALVAVKDGTYTLGPVQVSYFDIDDQTYKILSSDPMTIKASPSAGKEALIVSEPPALQPLSPLKQNKVEFTGRDILPLKTGLDALDSVSSLSMVRFMLYLLIPFICFIGVKIGSAVTHKTDDPKRMMSERAVQMLKQASCSMTDREQFLSCLYKALVSAVFSISGTKGESLTYLEAEQILVSGGCDHEQAARASTLLKNIESARYGGVELADAVRKKLLDECGQVVRSLC